MFARAALLAALFAAPAAAQDPAAAWAGRRALTPAVRYAVRWEPTAGGGPGTHGAAAVIFDFAGGRLRFDQDEDYCDSDRPGPPGRFRLSVRFDGREQSSFTALDRVASTAPAEPVVEHVFVDRWDAGLREWPGTLDPLLWAHGLARDPGQARWAFPLGPAFDPARFAPAGSETVDGQPCAVLRAAPVWWDGSVETVWVDAARSAAVVRHRQERPGRADAPGLTTVETEVSYQETAGGWLPAGWTGTVTRPGHAPAVYRRVRVESVRFDPPADDEFRITPPPGSRMHTPDGEYAVAADGTRHLVPLPEGDAPAPFLARQWEATIRSWWRSAIALAVVIAVCAVPVVVFVRLRRLAAE